jgi:predicted dehydrogenase
MNQVNWLLVGVGDISRKRVAAALSGAENSRLAAVCSRDRKKAQAMADQFGGCDVFTDFAEALAESTTEAVYLATPVWLHVGQALQALAAGKHVVVEKPLGLNAAECSKLVEAARKSGKLASCAYYRRFHPRYAYTKKMAESGEFGEIVSIHMAYSSWFDPAPDDPKFWRVIKAQSGGGPLCDMGSHMFDVMIGLFGLPESVDARCANLVHSWDVEDSTVCSMRLEGGAIVQSRFHWNSKHWRHEFEVVGTNAQLLWSPYDSGMVIKTSKGRLEEIDLPNSENVHLPLIENFVRAMITNRAPLSSLADALKTNILIDAVYKSASSCKEVNLN